MKYLSEILHASYRRSIGYMSELLTNIWCLKYLFIHTHTHVYIFGYAFIDIGSVYPNCGEIMTSLKNHSHC